MIAPKIKLLFTAYFLSFLVACGSSDSDLNIDGNASVGLPIDENVSAEQPVDENSPAEQPVDENIPAEQPVDENIPAEQPVDEIIPTEQPIDENTTPDTDGTTTTENPTAEIWRPQLSADVSVQPPKWDWQLQTPVVLNGDSSIEIYDIDMFDNENTGIVSVLHNAGKKVICYLDVGSWEDFRDDAAVFPASILGTVYSGFPDEKWLDIRDVNPEVSTTGTALADILKARFDRAQQMGCDALEPDNMDGYDQFAHESSGFPLTYEDQMYFNLWVAEEVHKRGMAVGLKNNVNQAQDPRSIEAFDFVVSEQCAQYNECANFSGFTDAGKPVFLAEYELTTEAFCPVAKANRLSATGKTVDLNTYRLNCDNYYNLDENASPEAVNTGGPLEVSWRPVLSTDVDVQPPKWDWQLKTPVVLNSDSSIEIYDIDMFDNETTETVSYLHANGKKVICYVDVGSWEDFREDAADFPASIIGTVYYGFPDENWLDIRDVNPDLSTTGTALASILRARFDRAQQMGCDALEPDNMDVYDDTAHESSGFPLTYEDQMYFNLWVAEEVHNRGMAVGLKNNINQAQDTRTIEAFDFVVSEQCVQYDECDYYSGFIDAGKPVFLAEYELTPEEFCPVAKTNRISATGKTVDLDTYRTNCDSYYNSDSESP